MKYIELLLLCSFHSNAANICRNWSLAQFYTKTKLLVPPKRIKFWKNSKQQMLQILRQNCICSLWRDCCVLYDPISHEMHVVQHNHYQCWTLLTIFWGCADHYLMQPLISLQDNGNFLVPLTSSKKTERKKLLLSTMLKDHVGQGGTKAITRYYKTRTLYS